MIKTAKFEISVSDGAKLPDFGKPEIAVAGKSNVGKSSFINFICNHGKLARTSGEPGRTRLLNYFEINNGDFYLVDLPGYGFARVAKEEKAKWGAMIEGYIQNSPNLKNVFMLLDIRHNPSPDDVMMFNYLYHYAIPFTVIATKCDKLSRAQYMNRRQELAKVLGIGKDNIYTTSALKKLGKDDIFARIDQILASGASEADETAAGESAANEKE